MNKLIIDNNISLKEITIDNDMDLILNIVDTSKKLIFNILPNVCLKVFDTSRNSSNEIVYNVENDCNIIINKLSIDCSDKIIMNLNDERTKVEFYTSIINYQDNSYRQIINHNKSGINTKIVNHSINVLDKEFKFIVDGRIVGSANDTSFKQDNKIINIANGKSFILPNLIVDNNDIEASHSAYIGTFDEDILFYMMTRGISIKEAHKILIKSFLINDMVLEDKERDIFNSIIENINIEVIN